MKLKHTSSNLSSSCPSLSIKQKTHAHSEECHVKKSSASNSVNSAERARLARNTKFCQMKGTSNHCRLAMRYGRDVSVVFCKMHRPDACLGALALEIAECVRASRHAYIRTDNGTEFVNKDLTEYYERVSIFHQKTVLRTPQQNGVVERQNRTLIEAARTLLIFSKTPMFLWAEAVATACYTQNRSLIHTRHIKTPYELMHDKKPDLTVFRVFGALCYPTNDSEDLGKLQPTADIRIFIGYAPSRKGARVERTGFSSVHGFSSESFNRFTPSSTTIDQDAPLQGIQREDNPFAPVDNDSFINVFAPEPSSEASSSGDLSSTESPYVTQTLHHLGKWSKDHPLDNIIGNPSRPVSTRKQLATDALWCLYNSVLSKVEPKNFISAITKDCWFQAMLDEIPPHEFDRLQV
ncbi:retrovirus-related pol polyprotein from transposon TNT 1-94 [Tanacetum coccineum]